MPKTRAARRAEAEKARASKDDAFEDKGEDASGASSAEGGVEPKAASGAAIIDTAAIKAAIKENEPTDTGGSVASSTAQVDEDDSSKCKGKVEKSAGDAIQAPGDKDDDSADDDDVDINFVCGPTAHKRALELITEGLCVFCEKKAIVGKAWSSTFKICRHAKCLAKNCFGSKEIDLTAEQQSYLPTVRKTYYSRKAFRYGYDMSYDAYLSSPNDYVMPAYKVETGAVPTSKKDLAAIAQQAKEREDANDQRCINIALAKTVKQQSKINKKKARADARDARIAGLEADLVKAKDKEGKGKGKAGEDICFRTALSALPQMCTRAGWDVALGTKLAPALFADFRSDERKSSKRKKTKVRDSLLAVTVAAERADIGFEGYWREATSGSTSAIGSGSAAAAAAGAAATAPMPPPSQSAGLLYLLPFSELCGGVDAFTRIVSSGVGIAQMASDMDTARVALVEADAERTRQKEKAAEEKAKKRRRRLLDVKVVKRNNLIPRVFCLPVVQQAIAHMVLEPRTLTLQSVPAATSGGGGGGGAAVTQPELFVNSSILIAMRDQLEEEELEGFRKILSKFSSEHLVLLGVHKLLVKEKKLPAKEEEELKHLDLGALFDLVYSAKAAGARSTRPRLLAAMKLAAKYPSSEGVGVSAAAKQIYIMLTHTAEQRRARLRKALRKKGLSLRSDSSFCRAYINGTTNACVFKVVATMQITRELFRSGHIAWSNNHTAWERHLEWSATKGGQSWWNATKDMPEIEYDSDDDYSDGGRECWRCGGPFPCDLCGRY